MSVAILLTALLLQSPAVVELPPAAVASGVSVRITSPRGRMGLPGTIRIVAQIRAENGADPGPVRFFIDGALYKTDEDGAPYVVEWEDVNPFERREIAVSVVDAAGREVRDAIVLDPYEVIQEAEVASVLVEASVQDKNGRFVKHLAQDTFTVREDGVTQPLDLVQHESLGAVFALLVDSSGSMARRIEFVQRTAATLARYMMPLDRMVIAPFAKQILSTTGPTADPATIAESISAIRAEGGTAIFDGLTQLSRSLPEANGRRAIILVTDGYDENSTVRPEDALAQLKEKRIVLYVVGVGGIAGVSFKGERVLRRLAEESGGRMFVPLNDRQLEDVQSALADDIQNRYLLTYTPANQKQDGSWRAISVSTTVPEYKVAARRGYFAPKPAPVRAAIEFTAMDPRGEYLNVSADDLEVYEDGVLQRVETFHEQTQPVSIVLALDASGSMRRKEADVIAAASAFTASLRPQDQLALLLFADGVTHVHEFSTDRNKTKESIARYTTVGGTALYDALADSLGLLQDTAARRVVVVMTDGRDENNPGTGPGSVRTLADVQTALKATGATVFPIGLGTKVDGKVLLQLAEASGGRALLPQDVSQLAGEFQRVVEDLGRRYIVGYTSTNGDHDGKWRSVRIVVRTAPKVDVRSKGGYSAPER